MYVLLFVWLFCGSLMSAVVGWRSLLLVVWWSLFEVVG